MQNRIYSLEYLIMAKIIRFGTLEDLQPQIGRVIVEHWERWDTAFMHVAKKLCIPGQKVI